MPGFPAGPERKRRESPGATRYRVRDEEQSADNTRDDSSSSVADAWPQTSLWLPTTLSPDREGQVSSLPSNRAFAGPATYCKGQARSHRQIRFQVTRQRWTH